MLDFPFGSSAPAGDLATVSPGVDWHRLPVVGPLGHVNCWLLDDGAGKAIVDTGYDDVETRGYWKAALDRNLVTQVICTHHHPDHSGLAGWLCAVHGAPLVMTRVEWLELHHFVTGVRTPPDAIDDHWRAMGWTDIDIEQSKRSWSALSALVGPPPQSFRRIVDGNRYRIGAAEWQVFVGGGHSPEHACLLDETAGVLIAGDQVLPAVTPNVSVTLSEPAGDPLGDWLASMTKLRLLDSDLLVLPGHGNPFRGLHARLDAMAAGHERRLDRLLHHIGEPRRVVDSIPALFRRPVGSSMLGMASGETLAYLRRLEVEGRAIRSESDGVWWFQAS